MPNEFVDVDAMEKAAALLVSHGDTMAKAGFNLDTGVHVDENGVSSPALATDHGGLDSLMIGKATSALLAAGKMVTPSSIAAMVGMMEDMEDDDEEDLDPGYAKSDAFRKSSDSFLAEYGDDPDVADTIDGNYVVQSILDKTSGHLARMQHNQGSFAKSQVDFNKKLALAVQQQGRLVKSLEGMLRERLGLVSRAPVSAPAGVRTPEQANAITKGGKVSAPATSGELTKAQLTSVLDYMGMEKSITHQGPVDIMKKSALIASGASVDEHTYAAAMGWLTANPAEAHFAMTYTAA